MCKQCIIYNKTKNKKLLKVIENIKNDNINWVILKKIIRINYNAGGLFHIVNEKTKK